MADAFPESLADLAERAFGAHGVEDARHDVGRGARRRGNSVERAADGVGIAYFFGRYRAPRSALPKSDTRVRPRACTNAEASWPGTPKTKGSPTDA